MTGRLAHLKTKGIIHLIFSYYIVLYTKVGKITIFFSEGDEYID